MITDTQWIGIYLVQFQANVAGVYSLTILLNEMELYGSPFAFNVEAGTVSDAAQSEITDWTSPIYAGEKF